MDENFLLHRKRALRLLELMEEHEKSWALYVFSSANVLRLIHHGAAGGLGNLLGVDGPRGRGASVYASSRASTPCSWSGSLQSHGIRVLGSTIIGLEEHTPENIDDVIDYAVSHDTDFHQFMLYTPIPGTPLWKKHQAGRHAPRRE